MGKGCERAERVDRAGAALEMDWRGGAGGRLAVVGDETIRIG